MPYRDLPALSYSASCRMTSAQRFGENLRELRQRRRLSQEALGARIDTDGPRISKLESGQENPTLETIDTIASALEVHASLLHTPRPEEESGREGTSYSTPLIARSLAAYLRDQVERPDNPLQAAVWRQRVVHAITTLLDALEHSGTATASGQAPEA